MRVNKRDKAEYKCIAEITDFVKANNITQFYEIKEYARRNRPDDWLPLLSHESAYLLKLYIASLRRKKKRLCAADENPQTSS
jgi:hypothetical protein